MPEVQNVHEIGQERMLFKVMDMHKMQMADTV